MFAIFVLLRIALKEYFFDQMESIFCVAIYQLCLVQRIVGDQRDGDDGLGIRKIPFGVTEKRALISILHICNCVLNTGVLSSECKY